MDTLYLDGMEHQDKYSTRQRYYIYIKNIFDTKNVVMGMTCPYQVQVLFRSLEGVARDEPELANSLIDEYYSLV